MKQYWLSLQPREQRTLFVGGVVLLLFGLYLFVIEPISNEIERLEDSVIRQQQDLAWMYGAADEVRRLRSSQGGVTSPSSATALMSRIDVEAKRLGLATALKQISPMGENVRVQFESAQFDNLIGWLAELSEKHHIAIDSLSIERLPQQGRVNASIVLKGAG